MQTMNRVSNEAINRNPWSEREKLPPVSPIHKAFAAIAVFLSALGLPICLWSGISAEFSEILGIALLILLCVYIVKVARSTPALALILCTAFFLTFSGVSFTGGALVLAVIVSIAAGAFLMTSTDRPYLTLLCHAAAFGVAFVITRDLVGSLLTFAVLPASLLMAYATLKAMWRTRVICFAAGGLIFTVAVVLIFHLQYAGVAFERGALVAYVDTLRAQLIDVLLSARNASFEAWKALPSGEKLYEQFQALYTDEMIRMTVAQLFNLLPSLLIVFCLVLSYEANSFLLAVHKSAGLEAVNTEVARCFSVGIPAAVIYFISFTLMLFLPSNSMASAVVQNLTLILLPGLALFGARRLLLLLYRLQGMMRALLLIGIFALLLCNLGTGLYLLALWGAYTCIGDLFRVMLLERMTKNGGDGDEPRE